MTADSFQGIQQENRFDVFKELINSCRLSLCFPTSIYLSLSLSHSLSIYIFQHPSLSSSLFYISRHVEQFFAFLRITKPKLSSAKGTEKEREMLTKMFNTKLNILRQYICRLTGIYHGGRLLCVSQHWLTHKTGPFRKVESCVRPLKFFAAKISVSTILHVRPTNHAQKSKLNNYFGRL